MKQKIKFVSAKTIFFVFIVAYIMTFSSLFGEANSLIGVISITATLMFLERDMTASFKKNTIFFILIYLFLGIMAHFATVNLYLGIFATFISLFVSGYVFSSYFYRPLYLPFGLGYLFMVSAPVSVEELPLRALALIAAGLSIMIVQWLFNRNTFLKKSERQLAKKCTQLSEFQLDVSADIQLLLKQVNDHQDHSGQLTLPAKQVLNTIVTIEQLSIQLQESVTEDEKQAIKRYLTHIVSVLETKEQAKLANEIKGLEAHPQLVKTLNRLSENVAAFDHTQKTGFFETQEPNLEEPSFVEQLKQQREKRTIRYAFGIRLAVAVTIAYFVWYFFDLQEGRWLAYSVLSLTNPMYEQSQQKTKDRISATIIGALFTLFLFSIIDDPMLQTVLIMFLGYLSTYTTTYKGNIYFVTMSAIGAALSITSLSLFDLVATRLIYVGLGGVIAIIIAKVVYLYTEENRVRQLKRYYIESVLAFIEEVNTKCCVGHTSTKQEYLHIAMLTSELQSHETLAESVRELLQRNSAALHHLYECHELEKEELAKTVEMIHTHTHELDELEFVIAN